MNQASLEGRLQALGGAVNMARSSQIGAYAFNPGVKLEFSNWRDEQRAWRETCVLFDQSHHMSDLTVEGPDAVRLISDLGINSVANFQPNKAKQLIVCSPDGHVIGDVILFFMEENKLRLVGRASVGNWVQYNAETGDYNVELTWDHRTAVNPSGRREEYRYQVQGPLAPQVLDKVIEGGRPEINFFNMAPVRIAGREVRALSHGMSGAPGMELFGPWEEAEEVRGAILEAGEEFGIRPVGGRVYPTNTLESGWIPCPLPAVFTGEELKPYREWLPADGYEGTGSLGGSFESDEISDYYLTPYELGYGPFVKFDHDFIGRDALESLGDQPPRRKVTLAWNNEDVARVMGSMFQKEEDPYRYIELPLSNYSTWPADKLVVDGDVVGLSTFSGYSFNERSMLSLAIVDSNVEIGNEVVLVWGESDGGAAKPGVEKHRQAEIRAIVSPCPYSEVARTSYHEGWRTQAAAGA